MLEAAAGQGLSAPASCARCGGILPSFAGSVVATAAASTPESAIAAPPSAELSAIRDELEAEVGSLFDNEPSREIKLGGYRLGDRRKNPRIIEPQTPAYQVVDMSGHDEAGLQPGPAVPTPAAAKADPPKVESGAPASAEDTAATPEKEVAWQPAASSLSALIQEQFSTSRRREPEPLDELVRPPEIKHKPAPPPTPERRPKPAFDGDFAALPVTDPSAVEEELPKLVAAATPRSDSMIAAAGSTPVVVVAQPNRLLIVLVAAGIFLMLAVIAGLLVVLIRSPQLTGRGVVIAPQTQPSGTVPPVVPPPPAATDAAVAQLVVDAANPFVILAARDAAPAARADAAVAVAVGGKVPDYGYTSDKPRPVDKLDPKPAVDVVKKPDKPTAKKDGEEEEEEEEKPAMPPGARPPGCDAVLFPNPADCPKNGPPGKEQILAVVRKHLGDIDTCAKRQHQIDPALATGVVEMRFWILATGETSRVEVLTEQYKKAPVGLCIKAAIEGWNFGEYDGPKVGPIKFPFKLKVE